jgi:sugar phosphate isomerase/epimerase
MNSQSCPDFIRQAGERLKALHIADNLGTNDDHMLPYGKGTLGWSEIMVALREVGYSGLFNYEVPGENRCPMPVRLAKLDYSLTLARWMIDHDGID